MRLFKTIIVLCFLIAPTIIYAGMISYNRNLASQYAKEHCGTGRPPDKGYNPDYKCFNPQKPECEKGGTDCANFVSQALIAGGLKFYSCINKSFPIKGAQARCDRAELIKGAVNISRNGSTLGVPVASDLEKVLTGIYQFKVVSIEKARPGDVVVWRNPWRCAKHVGVVVSGSPNYYFAAHTTDVCPEDIRPSNNRPYNYNDNYRAARVLHFEEPEDNKCFALEFNKKTCTTEWKPKFSKCETCDPETGQKKPRCSKGGGGRCATIMSCEVDTGQCTTAQGGDCPDETYTVGTGITEGVPSTSAYAAVGVLGYGFAYDMIGLLQSFNEEARIVSLSEVSPSLVQKMPLLIIPSAGLYGMENSEILKAALQEYVKEGGTILVLSQQHGYEYSVLPTPDGKVIRGRGWAEAISCFYRAAYIDTWHPVLAGLTTNTPDINIDGYFTGYPDNSTILLRRTANGQPAMLMYDYGLGKVIVTTLYSDWAYGHSQASGVIEI